MASWVYKYPKKILWVPEIIPDKMIFFHFNQILDVYMFYNYSKFFIVLWISYTVLKETSNSIYMGETIMKIWRNTLFTLSFNWTFKTRARFGLGTTLYYYLVPQQATLHRSQCTLLLWWWNLKLYVSQKLSDSSHFKCKISSSSKNDVITTTTN